MTAQDGAEIVELVAGEMDDWSDAFPARGAELTALVASVAAAVAARAGRTAIVLGPHDDTVVRAIAGAGVTTTLVLRSADDAAAAARRLDGLPVNVTTGDLDGIAGRTADLVVALDGLDRVVAVDRPLRAWQDRFAAVDELVAEGGALLLAIPNPASIRLVAGDAEAADGNADLAPDGAWDPTLPAWDELAARLPDAQVLATWPETAAPTLLAGTGAPVGAVLAHATPADGDPRVLPALARALRATAPERIAPGWVVVRGAHADLAATPGIMEVPASGDRSWLLDLRVAVASGRPDRWHPLVSTLGAAVTADPASWAGARAGAVLLRQGVPVVAHAFATAAPASAEEITIGLLDEAVDVIRASGWRHGWPHALGHDEQTVLVAGAAGVATDPDAVRRIRAARADRFAQAGSPLPPSWQATDPESARLADEAAALRHQVAWFKEQMVQRQALTQQVRVAAQRERRQLERRIAELEAQPQSGPVGSGPGGAASAKARAAVRRLRG